MTAALRRNLQFAVPDLIHDAQASGGSISFDGEHKCSARVFGWPISEKSHC